MRSESHRSLYLMYLKLLGDTACFYGFHDPKSTEFEFKFKPYCCPEVLESLCFEAELTSSMRSFFEQHGVEIDQDETKLYFGLETDGTIGWFSNIKGKTVSEICCIPYAAYDMPHM